jgi:methylated-DNA-protein-cysteine methyltransferase-like protein
MVARIPPGRVATYGQIARMAGFGRGARTAGWALRALPGGLRIEGRAVPWHRVINAAGRVSDRGGGGTGLEEARQRMLLRREGIRIAADGSIDLERYLWSGEDDRPGRGHRRTPRSASSG